MSSTKDRPQSDPASAGPMTEAKEKIVVHAKGDGPKPVRREFPGPPGADAPLRIGVDRRAQADLVAHAKESLDREVCGVLIGQVCEDQQGVFVHVEASIRGTAASEASTHVTFTQTTWNTIHKVLERDFPKLRIVGWYHTHPGFGVEFSEMDLFIQNNFFSGPTQLALVMDPLSGAVAICINTPQGPRYLSKYWVDGREQVASVPKRAAVESAPAAGSPAAAAPSGDTAQTLERLEARVGQLLQAHDELRGSYHRFLLFCGLVFCLGIIGAMAYMVWTSRAARLEPPRVLQVVPVPVKIDDKVMMLEVAVAGWEVPDELNAVMLEIEMQKRKLAEEAAKNAGTNAPDGGKKAGEQK